MFFFFSRTWTSCFMFFPKSNPINPRNQTHKHHYSKPYINNNLPISLYTSLLKTVEEEIVRVEREEDEESSSEITQLTRMMTLSTWGMREWKQRETTQHRPKALTSLILLKIRRRIKLGRRSKWSMWDCGSKNVRSDIVKKCRLVCDLNSLVEEVGLV